jgi:hypothetical protein
MNTGFGHGTSFSFGESTFEVAFASSVEGEYDGELVTIILDGTQTAIAPHLFRKVRLTGLLKAYTLKKGIYARQSKEGSHTTKLRLSDDRFQYQRPQTLSLDLVSHNHGTDLA